jgi:hypothetical protein
MNGDPDEGLRGCGSERIACAKREEDTKNDTANCM